MAIREIIFKGKRKLVPKVWVQWIEGDLNHIDGNVYVFERDACSDLNSPDWYEVAPESVCMFTGFRLRSGRRLFEEDILFDETEEDEGDRRTLYVVTWIRERGAFALLTASERITYEDNGIDGISRDFEGFYYELDRASILRMHYAGNYHDKPELLNQ